MVAGAFSCLLVALLNAFYLLEYVALFQLGNPLILLGGQMWVSTGVIPFQRAMLDGVSG